MSIYKMSGMTSSLYTEWSQVADIRNGAHIVAATPGRLLDVMDSGCPSQNFKVSGFQNITDVSCWDFRNEDGPHACTPNPTGGA